MRDTYIQCRSPISIDNEMKTVAHQQSELNGFERVTPIEWPRVMMNIGTVKRANINSQFNRSDVCVCEKEREKNQNINSATAKRKLLMFMNRLACIPFITDSVWYERFRATFAPCDA